MQGNRGPRSEQQNHGPQRQQPNPQQEQQRKPTGADSNGQHTDAGEQSSPSKWNSSIYTTIKLYIELSDVDWLTVFCPADAGFTIDLQNFKKPGEKTYTQRSRLFVGNLPAGTTEEDVEKLFSKYGKASEIFINKDRGFGFIRLVSLVRRHHEIKCDSKIMLDSLLIDCFFM